MGGAGAELPENMDPCLLVGATPPPEASWFMVGAEVVEVTLLLGDAIRLSMSMLRPD